MVKKIFLMILFFISIISPLNSCKNFFGGMSALSPGELSEDLFQFAYINYIDGAIYMQQSNNKNITNMENMIFVFTKFAITPDKQKIIASVINPIGFGFQIIDLWTYNIQSKEKTVLTYIQPQQPVGPDISKDGLKIVYMRYGSPIQIWLCSSDGTGHVNLSNDLSKHYYNPRFSPDGSKIVYYSRGTNNVEQIWIMNNNGTGKTELTNTTHNNYEPVFHPNGQKIFFVSERDGIAQIYSMDIDGKNQENFSKNYSFFDSSPYISDDGKILLFVRNRTYHHRSIWMKYLDGTGERQLTFYGDCYYPVFIKYLQ